MRTAGRRLAARREEAAVSGWELRRPVEGSPRACEGWRREWSDRGEQRNVTVAPAKVTELEMS